MLYLDASVLVPLIVRETTSAVTRDWLAQQDTPYRVSRLAIGEVGSAVSRRLRMAQLTAAEGDHALSLFDEWLSALATIVDHQSSDFADAASWVRRPVPKLLMPDAIHLATCRRLGCHLVTADMDLTAVADLLRIAWVTPK